MSQPTFSPPCRSHWEEAQTPSPPIAGIMLLAAARADVPAVCAMHPLLGQTAVTVMPQLLVSFPSLKASAISISY